MNKTTLLTVFVLIVLSILIFSKEDDAKYNGLKDDAVILAFGDSLTRGFGAKEGYSYPEVLERKTGLKVINAGINGEISSEGLTRLPRFLKDKPSLVILCHGGNDILDNLSEDTLKRNLLAMVNMIKQSGAIVVLIGVPEFSAFGLSTHEVYSEVAEQTNSIFENEVLREIQVSRSLKSDYVHPNEKGYELMADTFIEVLKENNLFR